MPIPAPAPNEKRDEYISNCMDALKNEKKPQAQKLAICFSTYKRAKQSKSSTEEPIWGEQIIENEDGDCIILI